MSLSSLQGKRILVTHADAFMGPAICQTLRAQGAEVIADTDPLLDIDAPAQLIGRVGTPDVLVANLALPAPNTRAPDVDEQEWQAVFDTMVHPLMRLCKAVLPRMQSRQAGKILLIGSAAALRGMKRASSYSAARGAQLAYIQAIGVEMAPDNIQINAIAQNFVDNPTYFPPEVQANPRFQQRLANEVPLGRLVSAEEDAEFVAYLCSDAANCFVGQVFPLSGGWATR
ncbi:SDR family NAD(P)-dependent oxidoreductase [Halopseudomonas salegens]|uniref:2-keto-3-deoxy-L-fuconate dehydrogenase n=1 Tax=Halopseudomonas salegens TaxID=1434072 RepID=A0A1H2H3A7_9GAMM|nr:SDR family oxidoreductase [Halopseudomonas salegens]SDU26350.1 2-keto-3-deoxy-L-fuconate dehydrogenase [Halopseudomonas salegens]